MSEALKSVIVFKKSLILQFLDGCTGRQQDMFRQMYARDTNMDLEYIVENMPDEKLNQAIRQCETSFLNNNKKLNT